MPVTIYPNDLREEAGSPDGRTLVSGSTGVTWVYVSQKSSVVTHTAAAPNTYSATCSKATSWNYPCRLRTITATGPDLLLGLAALVGYLEDYGCPTHGAVTPTGTATVTGRVIIVGTTTTNAQGMAVLPTPTAAQIASGAALRAVNATATGSKPTEYQYDRSTSTWYSISGLEAN